MKNYILGSDVLGATRVVKGISDAQFDQMLKEDEAKRVAQRNQAAARGWSSSEIAHEERMGWYRKTAGTDDRTNWGLSPLEWMAATNRPSNYVAPTQSAYSAFVQQGVSSGRGFGGLPASYYAPAAGGAFAARSCGANGMTWAHFLALAIFIACLVAVQYGVHKYRERKAAR